MNAFMPAPARMRLMLAVVGALAPTTLEAGLLPGVCR